MRKVPLDVATVFIHLPSALKQGLGRYNLLNGSNMDIFGNLHAHIDEKRERPDRLICPAGAISPTDGLLDFATVETVSDLIMARPVNAVLMFREESRDLLKCLVEYADLFGVEPVLLSGVPALNYPAEFEADCWELRRVPYHTVVNDLLEADRRQKDMTADVQAGSKEARERASYTKKNGSVKEFTAFRAPESIMKRDDDDSQSSGDSNA